MITVVGNITAEIASIINQATEYGRDAVMKQTSDGRWDIRISESTTDPGSPFDTGKTDENPADTGESTDELPL